MGPFDAWPSAGGGFETFYGFIGGENNQWDPALYDGTTPVEPPGDGGGGLPPHRGPDRPRGQLDTPAEGADARPAVLRLLRPRRDPRAASRAQGVGRQVRRPVRRRLGRPARADLRAAEGAGRHPRRRRAHRHATRRSLRGTTCPRSSSRCWRGRWRCTPASSSTPTTTWAGSSTPLEDLGMLDNTLIYYIIGDNGASAEGTMNGAFNEMANFNGMAALETPAFMQSARWTSSGRRARTTTTRSAGRGR